MPPALQSIAVNNVSELYSLTDEMQTLQPTPRSRRRA